MSFLIVYTIITEHKTRNNLNLLTLLIGLGIEEDYRRHLSLVEESPLYRSSRSITSLVLLISRNLLDRLYY